MNHGYKILNRTECWENFVKNRYLETTRHLVFVKVLGLKFLRYIYQDSKVARLPKPLIWMTEGLPRGVFRRFDLAAENFDGLNVRPKFWEFVDPIDMRKGFCEIDRFVKVCFSM